MLMPFSGAFGKERSAAVQQDPGPDYRIGNHWGIGVKATTGGIGLEVVKGLNSRTHVRFGFTRLNIPFSKELTIEGIDARAEANLEFRGNNLTVDFYPIKNLVHFSAGIVQNGMNHSVTLIPVAERAYGDITIPASELGTIKGEITPGMKFSPYMGLGFGNTLSNEHRVSFNFEMGALYHGTPKLNITGTNMFSPMASEKNIKTFRDAIAPYKWYPMVSFQLTVRLI